MKTVISILALAAMFVAGNARADLELIRAAAEAGDAEAQLELGILFDYGFNYKDNEIPALTWYMLSANQGNAKAARLRDALKGKMTEQAINEAMGQVAQYKPKPLPAGTAPYQTLRAPDSQPAPAAAAPAAPPPESASASAPAAAAPASEPAATPPPSPAPPAETPPIPETAPPATP